MDLIELVPGLHRLRVQGTHTHLLNAYLWLDQEAVTLIDTGATGSAPQIEAALTQLGRSRADVRTVLLTHFHEDHTGSAVEVAGWAGASVVCGADDAAVVRGERPGPPAVFTDAEQALFAQVSQDLPVAPPCRVDREVVDGDEVDFAGGAVVLSVPGHTPGSIAVHLPAHRVLFTGDTVAEADGRALLGVFNADRDQAWRSLRRQAGLDLGTVCVGHGEAITGDATAALRAATDPFA